MGTATSSIFRLTDRSVIDWCFFCEGNIRDFRSDDSSILYPQQAIRSHFAYGHRIYSPFSENTKNLIFSAFFSDQEHPFLRLAQHNLIGSHPALTLRNKLKVNFNPSAGTASHFTGGASQAGCTHPLDPHKPPTPHCLQTAFH